jgi:L-arabinokinase
LKHPDAPRRPRSTLAFSISGHGFGHASRQIEIINALGPRLPPDVSIIVRTSAARWLFDRTLRTPVTHAPAEVDTGIVQVDSLRLDERATVRAAREFYSTFERRVADEVAFIGEHHVRLMVADAPPLACAAAAEAGVPAIVIANFTWDWIYEAYEAFLLEAPDTLRTIRDAYAKASAAWRLPMYGGFRSFRTVEDLPFVARHARHSRDDVLEALGLPSSRPLVLSSFGGYGIDLDLSLLDCCSSWTVVVTGRPPCQAVPTNVAFVDEGRMYDSGLRYEDLVAAVDVVATKPGYGIISECVANGTALLYTSRGRFPEYDVMVREMPRVLRCAFLDQESLLTGRWQAALDALHASPAPSERPPTNGATAAAERILAFAT